jgi:hypothetical protein
MRTAVRWSLATVGFWIALSLTPGSATFAAKWDPVDPKELAATTPVVQKDADAEALLWDVTVSDQRIGVDVQTVYTHYLRIKIYTDRGRDAQSRVDIPLVGSVRVHDVEGRSIRRDGSFTELKKSDVFERDLIKAGGLKVRATSFVLPAVETGGIVEYRWREIHDDSLAHNLRLPLSRDIPVQLVKYHVAPLVGSSELFAMRGQPFHVNSTLKLGVERNFNVVSMANVPAHSDEPHAPPDWEVRPWMMLYYEYRTAPSDPNKYWAEFSKDVASDEKKTTSPTPEIQRATASLALGNASLDEKLTALVTFCRTKIKRVDVDTMSDAERKGFVENKSPTAALAAGRGTADDVIKLFVAMARAAGLDARLALLPSRNDVTFSGSWMVKALMRHLVVAVRDGDHWRFLDPTNEYGPDGHLSWTEELEPAIVTDEHELVTSSTPVSPPEWSLRSRTATLRLSEDGTLEGDVTTEYTGHLGMVYKEQDDHLAPAERESSLKDLMSGRLPGIELTDVHIDNVTAVDKPYTNRYHMKIQGYAQRNGSRLFIQPAVFQKGIAPEFPAAQRRYPVFFDHAWKEVDRVRIELPAGYQLESADTPVPVNFAPFGGYTVNLARTPDGRWVEMTREFFFGGGKRLQFPVEAYSPLKQFFDEVAKADAHALTLRKAASEGGQP